MTTPAAFLYRETPGEVGRLRILEGKSTIVRGPPQPSWSTPARVKNICERKFCITLNSSKRPELRNVKSFTSPMAKKQRRFSRCGPNHRLACERLPEGSTLGRERTPGRSESRAPNQSATAIF